MSGLRGPKPPSSTSQPGLQAGPLVLLLAVAPMCGAVRGPVRPWRQAGLAPVAGKLVCQPPALCTRRWCWAGTPVRDAALPLMPAFWDQNV